mmetsp:Transcript_34725/g.86640  ORF Transcript_34725/g.86640 Transcript_34725/m.86640 type:complete len:274 (+) Transcript_34725:1314-2135(+)
MRCRCRRMEGGRAGGTSHRTKKSSTLSSEYGSTPSAPSRCGNCSAAKLCVKATHSAQHSSSAPRKLSLRSRAFAKALVLRRFSSVCRMAPRLLTKRQTATSARASEPGGCCSLPGESPAPSPEKGMRAVSSRACASTFAPRDSSPLAATKRESGGPIAGLCPSTAVLSHATSSRDEAAGDCGASGCSGSCGVLCPPTELTRAGSGGSLTPTPLPISGGAPRSGVSETAEGVDAGTASASAPSGLVGVAGCKAAAARVAAEGCMPTSDSSTTAI